MDLLGVRVQILTYILFILNVKGVEAFFNTNHVFFSMEANSEDTFAPSTFLTLPDLLLRGLLDFLSVKRRQSSQI